MSTHRLAVYLILRRDDRVLFGLRRGTGYRDGEWGLPSGKLEAGERLLDAMVREAKEELGLDLDPASPRSGEAVDHLLEPALGGLEQPLHLVERVGGVLPPGGGQPFGEPAQPFDERRQLGVDRGELGTRSHMGTVYPTHRT